jgi:hypothetical protein
MTEAPFRHYCEGSNLRQFTMMLILKKSVKG